jgi:carbon-monoxide dehydrogenase large subunit
MGAATGAAWRPNAIGARIPRREDEPLLTGRGEYVADVRLPRMVEACFVRSQLAHARIAGIDTEAARALDGVLGVWTADDLDGMAAVPDLHKAARPVATYPLARERVRFVGAPLAVVVAGDRYEAEDAAELVMADLEALPVVAGMDAALAPDAPRLYEDWPDNRLIDAPASSPEVDEAFARLRTIGGSYELQRHGAVPMETRGVVADYRDGRLTVWSSTQYPHIVRTMLCYVLGLPERSIRVIAPHVGGGFGAKAQIYVEEYVIAWLALRLGRPVRWIEDRYEHLVTAAHARDVRFRLEAAVREDGTIEALRGHILQDLGSGEMYPPGFNPSFVAVGTVTGPYRIPLQAIGVTAVVSNKTPSGAYRGFGMPESTFAMERLIDKIGRELGIDPLDVRRRMLLDPSDLPYETASGARLDSGSFREAFERAVTAGEAAAARVRERVAGDPHVRVGLGIATYVEGTAANYRFTSGHWGHQETVDDTRRPSTCASTRTAARRWRSASRRPARACRRWSRRSPPTRSGFRSTTCASCWATPTRAPSGSAASRAARRSWWPVRSTTRPASCARRACGSRRTCWRRRPATSKCATAASRCAARPTASSAGETWRPPRSFGRSNCPTTSARGWRRGPSGSRPSSRRSCDPTARSTRARRTPTRPTPRS